MMSHRAGLCAPHPCLQQQRHGQEPCFLPEPTWTQKKTIFAPLQNSSFFSRVPISYHFEEEAGFGADSGCLPRPASEEAVSSPTFQGTHKGLIKN